MKKISSSVLHEKEKKKSGYFWVLFSFKDDINILREFSD